MTDTARTTKISLALATKEAAALASRLLDPACDADTLGRELAARFAPTARRDILDVLVRKLGVQSARVPAQHLYRLLLQLAHGAKQPYLSAHLEALLRSAMGAPDGMDAAAMLLHDFATGGVRGVEIPPEDLRALGSVPGVTPVVVRAMLLAGERGTLTPDCLPRWNACLVPLLGMRRDGDRFSRPDAEQVLEVLTSVDRGSFPDELLLTIDRLRRLAEPAATVGKPESERAGPSLLPPYDDLLGLVRAAAASHSRDVNALMNRSLELQSELDRLRIRLQSSERSAASLRDNLGGENERLRTEVTGLSARIAKLQDDLTAAEDQRTVWAGEAALARKEAAMLLEQQAQEQRNDLRSALAKPSSNLRDRVKALLMTRRDDTPIRLMAATFDNLHVRILRLTGEPDEERIPAELLRDPRGGA